MSTTSLHSIICLASFFCARALCCVFRFAADIFNGSLFRPLSDTGGTYLDNSLAKTVPRLLTQLLSQPAIHAVRHVRRALRAWLGVVDPRQVVATTLCLHRGCVRLWARISILGWPVCRCLRRRLLFGAHVVLLCFWSDMQVSGLIITSQLAFGGLTFE